MAAPVTGTVVSTKTPSMVGAVGTMTGVTCGGVNRGVVVDLFVQYSSGTVIPTGVTYGGAATTLLKNVTSITGEIIQARYFLTAPATGSQSVVVTLATTTNFIALWIAATPLEDVDQTTPYATSVSSVWDQSNVATTFSVTDTNSATGTLELDAALGIRGGQFPIVAPDSPQTQTFNLAGNATFAFAGSKDAGATNVNMGWGATSDAGGVAYSLISTSFKPVAPAAPMTVGQGSYTLTGQDVALQAGRKLVLDSGSFALTGQAVTLTYSGAPVFTGVNTTGFAGFGGGGFASAEERRELKKKKRKKKCDDDEELCTPTQVLQEALAEMLAKNAPPMPDTRTVYIPPPPKTVRSVSNEAMARRKRLKNDDDELMIIFKQL